MAPKRKRDTSSPAQRSAKAIRKKYKAKGKRMTLEKAANVRRALFSRTLPSVSSSEPCMPSSSTTDDKASTPIEDNKLHITVENSVIKGFHVYKIKQPKTDPQTKLIVDREYTNIHDQDACLVWIPELSHFDENLHELMTDDKRQLKLSDIAGLPMGHVPKVLGMKGEIYAVVTDMEAKRQRVNPTKDDFPYKVELHVHLDGAFRLSSVFEIARRRGIELNATSLDEFRKSICVYHAHSLYNVLASFVVFMPIVAGDREAMSRLVYEFCEDCARNNIKYVEARYSPHLLASSEPKPEYALQHGDLTPREVVQIVNAAVHKGSKEFGIRVKTILCCIRHRPDWSEEVVDLALEFRNEGVVAIDIAGGSNHEDVEECLTEHKKAFTRAKKLGMHITVHAGEAGPAANVKKALDDMHAERIGHGYRVLEDEQIYKEIREKHVHLETCPISSLCTGAVPEDIHQHPVVRFAEDGANYSLNSDDPFVFDSCLLDDYNAAREMGLTDEHIIRSIFNAAKSCFAPEEEKKQILNDLADTYGKQYINE